MKIRNARIKEKENLKKIWEDNFNDTEEQVNFYFSKVFDSKNCMILEEEKIKSSLYHNPYFINFNKNLFNSFYIVGVTTEATHRNRGYMKKLMLETLKKFKKNKIPAIFLTPINPEIYRNFDFEYFSKIEKYKILLGNLSKINTEKNYDIVEVTEKNKSEYISDLIKIYNKKMEKYHIFLERDEYYFNKILEEAKSDGMNCYLFFNKKNPEGYVIFGKYDNEINVREIFALNEKVMKTALKFLGSYSDYYRDILFNTPLNTNLEFYFSNQLKVSKKIHNFMMLRIIDPLYFLKNLKNKCKNVNFKIYIEDKIFSENTGTYQVGKDITYIGQATDNDFEIKISDFTMLVTGFLGFTELVELGKIKVKSKDKKLLLSLEEFFSKQNSYFYEFI